MRSKHSATERKKTPRTRRQSSAPPPVRTGKRAITPPRELQTDPGRGTGELGTENVDPSQPLVDQPPTAKR